MALKRQRVLQNILFGLAGKASKNLLDNKEKQKKQGLLGVDKEIKDTELKRIIGEIMRKK